MTGYEGTTAPILFVNAQNVGEKVVKCSVVMGFEAASSIRPGLISLLLYFRLSLTILMV